MQNHLTRKLIIETRIKLVHIVRLELWIDKSNGSTRARSGSHAAAGNRAQTCKKDIRITVCRKACQGIAARAGEIVLFARSAQCRELIFAVCVSKVITC